MTRETLPFGSISRCQVCAYPDLVSVLFLGFLPPVNRMRDIGTVPAEEEWFPAEMLCCPRCHLAQLGYAADPSLLFPPDYPYTSGTTRVLRDNFAELYAEVRGRGYIQTDELAVDIGSNDGTLLSNFAAGQHRVVGIEPSLTANLAINKGIPTLMTFFGHEAVQEVRRTYGLAKIVTAANVFAHIHNVHQVLDNIEQLLSEDGVFISESHYLYDLIQTLQYDTIYHEHLRYYSLSSLKHLLEEHGFHVFYAKRIPTHGGSIRVYASKSSNYHVEPAVQDILDLEQHAGLVDESWIEGFRQRVVGSKLQLYKLLAELGVPGTPVYGIGAPSRASTLVTYTGLDGGMMDCVLELAGSKKVGKYLPGTKIPVLEEAKLYEDQPPFALLLSWHIASELCQNLRRHGFKGDFIVPLPAPHVVRGDSVELS